MSTSKKGFICFVAVCLIAGGLASSASAELLGLWQFNEGSGLTTADASGHGRTGDITARIWTDAEGWITSTDPAYIPTWVDGPADHGKALQFHPSYDESGWPGPVGTPYSVPFVFVYADSRKTPYDNPYDLRGSFTFAAWVSLENDGSGGVRGSEHGSVFGLANAYQFETPSNTEASFRAWDNSWLWGIEEALAPASPVPVDTWTHVAYTYDFPTRTMKLYINGTQSNSVIVPSADAAATYPGSPWDLRIGAHANEDAGDYLRALSGKLDDVAVFNEALDAGQIGDIMGGDFSAWPYVPPPGGEPQDKGDLLGLWQFNEGSGMVAEDASAYQHDGDLGAATTEGPWAEWAPSIYGTDAAPEWVDGPPGHGNALYFTQGTSGNFARPYVHVPATAALDLGSEFTIAAWVNAEESDDWPYVVCRSSSYKLGLPNQGVGITDPLEYPGPDVWVEVDNWEGSWLTASVFTGANFQMGEWQHLAVTYGGGQFTVYINGELIGSGAFSTTTPIPGDSRGLFMGFNACSWMTPSMEPWGDLKGALDDVAIFKKALSQGQVQTIMSGNFSGWLPSEPAPEGIVANPRGWVSEGTVVTLTAPDGGTNYQWRFEGEPMSDDPDRVTGATSRVLRFDPVTVDDAGTYTCAYDDGTGKAPVETPAYELVVFAAGALPVAGMVGLGLLAALTAIGGVVMRRR